MNMEQMILQAKEKGHDITPDITYLGEWESTFYNEHGFPNTFRGFTAEDAVRMAYEALMGSK
jgi:hypothetical protein